MPPILSPRHAFEFWLERHRAQSFQLALPDTRLERRTILGRIARLSGQQRAAEYLCVLLERRSAEDTPAFVGRSSAPLRDWADHLAALEGGEGLYRRWHTRLMREGLGRVRFELLLYMVGLAEGEGEALEQEVKAWAAAAYPLPLLTLERLGPNTA